MTGQRITDGLLGAKLHRLNMLQFNNTVPEDYFTPGRFQIYHAYGGVQLHQCKSTGGAVDDVFRCGFMTKRELFEKMDAFISGILYEKHKGETL